MEEPSGGLTRRFILTAASARFDVKVDILVNPRPIIFSHEGTMGLIDSKVISQFIVVQLQEFLTGYPIIGEDAKMSFKENESIFQLKKGVPLGVLNDGSK